MWDEPNICPLSPHLTIARLTNKAVLKKVIYIPTTSYNIIILLYICLDVNSCGVSTSINQEYTTAESDASSITFQSLFYFLYASK